MTIDAANLITHAERALAPRERHGTWLADVGAALVTADGNIFTGACIGGPYGLCAEAVALGNLVSAGYEQFDAVVAVWRKPEDGQLHVIPPCGRCREMMRSLDQSNLEATVILGATHEVALAELLPYPFWHSELAR